jgi:hypothetical protein
MLRQRMATKYGSGPGQFPDTRPVYERIQDWVFKLDVGAGVEWYRLGLFCLLVVFVVLLYTGARFYGLRDAEAMDLGQLGRNLWRQHSYVTQNIRPVSLGYLASIERPPLRPDGTQPELWTPPVYPTVLAVLFRLVQPSFEPTAGASTMAADRLMMGLAWGFFVVGLVLMYLLARDLFDHRVAVLSAFLYLFCDPLLDGAIAGLPLHFLAVLFLVAVFGVYKAEQWLAASKSGWRVNTALIVSALAVAVGTLTRYAFAAVLLPLLVYLAVAFPKSRWRVGLCLGVFLLVLTPWVARNWRVSQTFFGLASYEVYEETGKGTDREIRTGQLQRTYQLDADSLRVRRLTRKVVVNLRGLYEKGFKQIGANYLMVFFLVALLHRFRRDEVSRLRRLVLWSLLAALVPLSVAAPTRWNFLNVFLPVVIIYGAASFLVIFERLQFRTRFLRYGTMGLFVGLNALPVVFTLLPPVTTLPYPPYNGGIVADFRRTFRAEEMLASDVPWAVAWYADRSCLWLPNEREEFITINDNVRVIAGIYLTQETLTQMNILQLITGRQLFWAQLFRMPPPAEFPLQVVHALPPDGQQVLISNRQR